MLCKKDHFVTVKMMTSHNKTVDIEDNKVQVMSEMHGLKRSNTNFFSTFLYGTSLEVQRGHKEHVKAIVKT